MATALKRSISLLLVLVLAFGVIPIAFAAETEATDSTDPTESTTIPTEETLPLETTESTEPPETTSAAEETTAPTETTDTPVMFMTDSGIATIAEAEINGAPNAFANLTLPNGGIDIPAQGYMQHKKVLPLYSLYLKNQTGYANNYYVAYCIEPGVELANSGGHDGTAYTVNDMVDGSGALYRINRDQVEAIGIALLYGQKEIASKKDEQSLRYEKLCRHAATQAIVWEIACGWRSPYPPYTLWDTTLFDAITPSLYCASSVWGTNFYLDGMDDAYLDIQAKMQQHYTIPSFANASKSSAPTYELKPDGNGKYSITLTDTNNILNQFSFTNTSQLTFSVSGNKLTITANSPISSTTVTGGKSVPSLDQQVFFVWEKRELQKLMSCKTDMVYESLPAYFKVYAPNPTGSLSLTKTTEDGKNLSGWQFGIYTNSACTALAAGPFTTDSSGKISVTDLTAGTYYVKELGHTDSTINTLYYCSSTNPQKVTITAGSTDSVSFTNKLNTGSLALTKTTEDGKNLIGWQFSIYSNSACTTLVSGPHATNSTGKISVTGLKPGTYYVKEIGHTDSNINSLYYCDSTNPQKITITANNTASVSFSNKLNTGTLNLTKSTEDNKNLEGWQFSIYSDSSCSTLVSGPHTTDSTGKISVTDLKPGTYYVKEIVHTDSSINALYTCASTNPQKVTITGNATTKVSFQNKLNTGSVKLVKETSCGDHLECWQIGLYTDAACTKAVSGSPFTTGEDGSVTVSDLSVGTLYAKEIPVDDPYWACDPEVKTITIEAGKTATITFLNIHYGNIRITKNAVNGSAEGWSFQILDANKNTVDTVKSGADGYAYSDILLPGQYFIREVHDQEDTYWEYDTVVEKEVTVTAGSQAEAMYTNTQYGKIQIQKSMPDGGSLDGWQFHIADTSGKEIEGSPFTTNASGLILTGKLQPGEYTVMELIPEGSFYYCTSENPQTITVKAGEAAQVSFTNAMRHGQITIEKVDSRGEPLAGAKFLLEWSEDGSLWWPIEYSETLGEGKCSNSNIEDGCLTSDKDGLLEWPDLHPGLYYRVTELEAPEGYTLLSVPAFEGKLPNEELTVSLRVVNCEIFTLPQTGSSAAAFFRISQLLCICVCSILLIHSYRKECKK